ncbi:serpin family protein [Romboutsia sp.]|uniref:serpin family protein n=1 Tax=Romboutsia sp. TaxID=1965302 RepID=UPI003F346EAA
MKKNLKESLNYIEEELIEEAINSKKRKTKNKIVPMVLSVAACVALVFVTTFNKSSVTTVLAASYPKGYSYDDYDKRTDTYNKNPLNENVINNINKFTFKTSSKLLANDEENVLYSPLSLYYALAMATEGAKGQTKDELLNLLEVKDEKNLANSLGNLYRVLYKDNEISKLKIANSIWADDEVNGKNINYKKEYIDTLSKDYYASLYTADFSKEETYKEMEKWIKTNTNNTLNFNETPDPDQVMTILNTVYFYDEWIRVFDKKDTKKDVFTLSNGEQIKSDYMSNTGNVSSYKIGKEYISSSLGLKNGGEMVFILPNKGENIENLISSEKKLEEIFTRDYNNSGIVDWKIPKFSYGDSLEIKKSLQSLGIESAFNDNADFTNITNSKILISDIKQNTHISIDEKGVEASAYSQIMFDMGDMPEDRIEMNLNRPFIYGILSETGNLLFVGVCNNPNK